MVVEASTKNLASLFSLNRQLEVIPEPYRMQKNFIVVVSYDVFVNYMYNAQLPSSVIDNVIFADIKQCIVNNNLDSVLSYYYVMLAKAQLKEVAIAEEYGETATLIVPRVKSTEIVKYKDINFIAAMLEDSAEPLLAEFNRNGYTFGEISYGNLDAYGLGIYYNHVGCSSKKWCNVSLPEALIKG